MPQQGPCAALDHLVENLGILQNGLPPRLYGTSRVITVSVGDRPTPAHVPRERGGNPAVKS